MSSKQWRKGVPFHAEVAPWVRHMPLVEEYRENLLRLQAVWDSLALLGQMSGAAADIAHTRAAFEALTARLLDSLARRLLDNARQRLQGQAQVAIDILVRNLFERTADVGFLAADAPLRTLASSGDKAADARAALEARFRAYVAKYSVYDDIILLSPQGQVLARLDRSVSATHSADPLLAQALRPGVPYAQRHGATDLLGGRTGLIFASAVRGEEGGEAPCGVLCLSFRLADEMRSVFAQLLPPGERTVLTLVDAEGLVLQSSDAWQIPPGARLPAVSGQRLVFAGRDYLAVAAPANTYEGYAGPGWSAVAMVPVEQAFDREQAGQSDAGEALTAGLDTRDLFDAELHGIPLEASRIQRDLSRSLWNGSLRSRSRAESAGFAITLLGEVERTGQRLRLVFEQAIANLHHSALAAVFDSAVFHARLAIDIMDRNLYERANDCRWWALDAELQRLLSGEATVAQAGERLRHINSLYTVYALLVVFDAEGRVLAVSDPAQAHHQGRRLDAPWVSATLALRDRERYAVSPHAACGLYGEHGERPTYVYAAALPAPDDASRVLGGIAVVFDGEPQFAAMLRDARPPGASAMLLSRDGRVVSSTDSRWPVGGSGPLASADLALAAGETRRCELEIDGLVHAVGIAMSGGYREYRRGATPGEQDVAAVMLMPLGQRLAPSAGLPPAFEPGLFRPEPGTAMLDVASFIVDGQWLGLPARQTLQALERPRITGMPNAPAALLGMLSHQEQMLPVLDLGRLLYGRSSAASEAPVLVCQREGGQRLALCVQELGQVFSVAAESARPSPTRGGAGRERLVRGAAGGQMLTLLDVEDVWRQLAGGELAAGLDLIEG
ncbi:chemotaxis protein CheW [Paucibacter sp. PLA-PC-4]|uniref:chemotaxis protein CheW n=1 Tax=Paucibacter sp. PLA-PC-4 TaxID=2993655 RepID=UPI00224B5CB2|nr:chemotaxis protein CheW [Paucibacter sp. PLA-PC-4]MCX2863787.1 chemotaxis protein CheW [Paucibacter sp. PLA-PC-4]